MAAKIVKGSEFEKKRSLEEEVKTTQTRHAVNIGEEGGGVIDRKSLESKSRAERIIADAEAEAAKIRERAQRVLSDVEAVREKARKEGFAAGETKGLSQVTEKLVHLEAMRERFYKDAEPGVVKLVMAIAEKVIGSIAAERPEVIRDVVRQALERSLGDRITVRVNPEDYKKIHDGSYEFRDVLDRTKRLHFKEDETVSKGGCIVETEVGTIDAQIETQMEAIKKALG